MVFTAVAHYAAIGVAPSQQKGLRAVLLALEKEVAWVNSLAALREAEAGMSEEDLRAWPRMFR